MLVCFLTSIWKDVSFEPGTALSTAADALSALLPGQLQCVTTLSIAGCSVCGHQQNNRNERNGEFQILETNRLQRGALEVMMEKF